MFAQYLDALKMQGKILMYSHIPNETFTKFPSVRLKNKQEGVHTGVPDYIIVTKDKVMFIELKRLKKYKVSDDQLEWLKGLANKKTVSAVAIGSRGAEKFVESEL